jgi:hypothetical protein
LWKVRFAQSSPGSMPLLIFPVVAGVDAASLDCRLELVQLVVHLVVRRGHQQGQGVQRARQTLLRRSQILQPVVEREEDDKYERVC